MKVKQVYAATTVSFVFITDDHPEPFVVIDWNKLNKLWCSKKYESNINFLEGFVYAMSLQRFEEHNKKYRRRSVFVDETLYANPDYDPDEELDAFRGCVQYFVDRVEQPDHPDGPIRSRKTYELFKSVQGEFLH